VFGKDLAGNISPVPSQDAITYDTDAPLLPASFSIADSTSGSTVFTNSSTFAYSIASCETGSYILVQESQSSAPSENSGSWFDCATTGNASLNSWNDGSKTLYFWVRDAAGNINVSSLSASITYDTQQPSAPMFSVVDADALSDSGYTNASPVSGTISSCFDIAGVKVVEGWNPPTESEINEACATSAGHYGITFSTVSQGSKGFYLWFKDAAGNISSTYASITYDTTAPVISNFKVSGVTATTITSTWSSGSDSIYTQLRWGTASGVYSDSYAGSDNTSHSYTISTQNGSNLAAGTDYFLSARAIDHAEQAGTHPELSAQVAGISTVVGTADNEYLGTSANPSASSGPSKQPIAVCDINGDGRDDLIIGAPQATNTLNGNSRTSAGMVYVILGSASPASSYSLPTSASLKIGGKAANNFFGSTILCGQFSGDSKKDLWIHGTSGNTFYFEGRGAFDGSTTTSLDANVGTDYTATIATAPYGSSIGNVDGDSYDDLVLCTTSSCNGYLGSAVANATSDFNVTNGSSTTGMGVAIADVDGNGYGDIIVPDYWSSNFDSSKQEVGIIKIYRTSSGVSGTLTANTTVYGYVASGKMGMVVPGDLDNDGYTDLLIKDMYAWDQGNVQVVWGRSAATWDAISSGRLDLTAADRIFSGVRTKPNDGNATPWNATQSFAIIKDLDGDSAPDLFIGSGGESANSRTYSGRACAFRSRNRAGWTSGTPWAVSTANQADFCIDGASTNDFLGAAVAAGNFDGVGGPELIAVAPSGDGPAVASGANRGEISIISIKFPTSYVRPLPFDTSPHF
jgi:hypothetical protein